MKMTNDIEMNEKTTNSTKFKTRLSRLSIKTRRIIRYLIIICCVFGLVFQTTQLYTQYSKRQTVVNIKVEKNKYTSIPAITVCYPAMVSMERMAEKYPKLRPLFNEYKNRIKNISENDYKNETLVKEINDLYENNFTFFSDQKLKVKDLFDLSINFFPGVFIQTQVNGMRHYSNGSVSEFGADDTTPVQSFVFDVEGYFKCLTFFSHLNETFRPIEMHIKNITVRIYHNENWFPSTLYENAYYLGFSMHSPNAIPNRYNTNNFNLLKAGNIHYLSYNLWKTVLLPPPYQTNCRDYDLDDKQDIRLRSDCVNYCIYDGLSQECADHSIDTTYSWKDCLEKTDLIWRKESFNNSLGDIEICLNNYDKITNHSHKMECHRNAMNEISTNCEVKCQPECDNRFYNYNYLLQSKRIWNKTLKKSTTWVEIVHNQMPDQMVENIPEMTFISFAANFGGLLGMWLGLSALALLHYFIKIL